MAILFSVNWAILSAQYGPINDWPTERIHKSRALPDSFHSFASVRSGQPPSRRSPPAPPPAIASLPSAARMTEAPFLPRERLFKQQHYFQNLTKHTYLKGRFDVITSVAIPLALAASSMFMIGRGVYNMSHGIGKKE